MSRHTPLVRTLAPLLRKGHIGVLPTDTIYGIVGSALKKATVLHVYRLRKRNPKKPMIILIGSMSDLVRFGVRPTPADKKVLRRVWPGAMSVVLPCRGKKLAYLHRGTNTLAFRMPKPAWLRGLLASTGPLVAPSANFEGERPARTIPEAKKYFGDSVAFYADRGRLVSKPSTLIALEKGRISLLRKGATPVKA